MNGPLLNRVTQQSRFVLTASIPVPTVVEDSPCDLVTTQVNFGLAYAQEAREAYESGRDEYGDLARDIAMRAYSTAVRFASRLSSAASRSFTSELTKLETEVDGLLGSQRTRLRSIA